MAEEVDSLGTIATLASLRPGWIAPSGLGITAPGHGWLDPTAPVATQPSLERPIRVMGYPGAWEVLLTVDCPLIGIEQPPAHWQRAFVRGPRLSATLAPGP